MQKFWEKNKKLLTKNKQGLTFVEVSVAIAVLSITILASTAVSATYLRNRISIKKYQANNEELSVALNSMSKDIRMSNSLDAGTGVRSSIRIESNVDSSSITYAFNSGSLTRNGILVASNVEGGFFVSGDPTTTIPRITIRIKKEGLPGIPVQTTVSMRSGYTPTP
jgi:prepilin-type N-terminal cleavage/methylation domain-containing protein